MQETNLLDSSLTSLALGKRTARVVMTDEARVLRELRIKRKLSMRALGARMNKSDSYISQVENGRMDIPTGAGLDSYLQAIEGITQKSFFDRVRTFRQERRRTDREEIIEIAKRINDSQARQILVLARTILASELNMHVGGVNEGDY